MEDPSDFGALLRSLREHHGLTQEQFAHMLGVSFSTVNVWENGKRSPLPFLRKRVMELAADAGLDTPSTIAAPLRRTR